MATNHPLRGETLMQMFGLSGKWVDPLLKVPLLVPEHFRQCAADEQRAEKWREAQPISDDHVDDLERSFWQSGAGFGTMARRQECSRRIH